jgi:flavin reductase (DIM6/NTAB) family NADH-FMN oxidoreductase RutF
MREISPPDLNIRPFHLLDQEWAVLVGGTADRSNPMTVSWGGAGTLWNRSVVTVYVRPTRYTYELLEANREFSLNFLGAEGREALDICGTVSGRGEDKWKLSGLVPDKSSRISAPRVSTARLLFECRILAHLDFDPKRFIEPGLNKLYPLSDYHRVYFGEVLFAAERSPS